jgi:hypothetical protein
MWRQREEARHFWPGPDRLDAWDVDRVNGPAVALAYLLRSDLSARQSRVRRMPGCLTEPAFALGSIDVR